MTLADGQRVEVVRGGLDRELSSRLVEFWVGHGALDQAAAQERLAEVICVLRGSEDQILATNSAFAATAPLVGRQFWIYRRFLAPGIGVEAERAMLIAAREALEDEFAQSADEPVGLCVLIADRTVAERHPEAVWPEVGLLFAGYTEAGAQVRISYFEGARI
jgi:hypothetical protein